MRTMIGLAFVIGLTGLALTAIDPLAAADEKAPASIVPVGADGKPLNLGFESGDLDGWTAEGDAFKGQPIKGDVLETPDWKSKVARRKEVDGGDKIVLVDPPWVGFDFIVAKDGTLVLDLGQEKYVFKHL